MEEIQKRINNLDIEIMNRLKRLKEDLEMSMSIPGIGFISASSILAEIGNYRDFANRNKLAAWCGLVPSIIPFWRFLQKYPFLGVRAQIPKIQFLREKEYNLPTYTT
jgi:hypothetical protein